MSTLKLIHTLLAAMSVAGFLLRAFWKHQDDLERLRATWVRVLPHIVDTLLLTLGVLLALPYGFAFLDGWLGAKLIGVVVYIGFGIMTLRATSRARMQIGFAGAIVSVGYVFAVAITKSALPFWSH